MRWCRNPGDEKGDKKGTKGTKAKRGRVTPAENDSTLPMNSRYCKVIRRRLTSNLVVGIANKDMGLSKSLDASISGPLLIC